MTSKKGQISQKKNQIPQKANQTTSSEGKTSTKDSNPKNKDGLNRIISGLVLVSLLGFALWSQTPYFFLVLASLVLALALWEYYRIAEKVGCKCHQIQGYLASFVIVYGFSQSNQPEKFVLPTLAALLTTMMITSLIESEKEEDFHKVLGSVAATLLGVCYVVLLASFLIGVRFNAPYPKASQLLSLFFLIIVASDTGAYYVGKTFGKTKLVPLISPKKTVAGSIGGIFGSIIAALISKFTFFPEIAFSHCLILAVVMNIIGQMGDLFESLLKRGSGVKDAASIIPGHGGLLDRLDSILFNAPLLYYYFLYFS
jgi:phosphatidate cytidylyltransferase